MGELVTLTGARMEWDGSLKAFVMFLDAPNRNGIIRALPGMWLVTNGNGWVAMTDKNFQRKYQKEEE